MNFIVILLVAAATFGICYILDKGFTRAFRSQAQHRSGLAVRLTKRYAVFGLGLTLLGILAILTGIPQEPVLIAGGGVVLLLGLGLIVYYLSFGIYYDADSFLYTVFGRKGLVRSFGDIQGQRLYLLQGGSVIVELHLSGGDSISVQTSMDGACPFLDHAFSAWCRQTGREPEACGFHDPSQSLWFPPVEDV